MGVRQRLGLLFKCHCGCTVGLACFDDRWWCPTCLWKEVETLRAQRKELLEACEAAQGYVAEYACDNPEHQILALVDAAITKATGEEA